MSGPNPNALCIFPFKFNGITYHQCTTAGNAEGDINPWCSTLVDDSGIHIGGGAGNWGNCCPANSDCECKEEDENSQNTNTEDPNYIFPNVRSDCNTCNCGYVKNVSIEFIECHESHRYICEYKGGPSCPDGMFSLYGKCLGFVKNIMDDNTANDKTCYFQSGAVHNYRLAEVENIQVQFIFY